MVYGKYAKVGGPQISSANFKIRNLADLLNLFDMWQFADFQFADRIFAI
jgi:hypothetical protein